MAVILEWLKIEKAVSYKVEHSLTGDAGTFTEIATGLPGHQFLHDTGTTSDFYNITGINRLGDDLEITTPLSLYDSQLVCKIFGTILDATARPETSAEVRFEIRSEDSPQIVQGGLVATNEAKTVPLNAVGKFEIYLLRDLLVEMFVPSTKFKVLFMVPDEDEKDFTQLVPDFGFETKINNPL